MAGPAGRTGWGGGAWRGHLLARAARARERSTVPECVSGPQEARRTLDRDFRAIRCALIRRAAAQVARAATSIRTTIAVAAAVSGAFTSITPSTATARPYAAIEKRSAEAAKVAMVSPTGGCRDADDDWRRRTTIASQAGRRK